MSKAYRLTPEAQAGVEEICAFVAEDSIDAALRVLEEFERAFDQLAATPGLGHKREDLTRRPVRFWGVFSYLVVYDPESTPLTVRWNLRDGWRGGHGESPGRGGGAAELISAEPS